MARESTVRLGAGSMVKARRLACRYQVDIETVVLAAIDVMDLVVSHNDKVPQERPRVRMRGASMPESIAGILGRVVRGQGA